MTVVNAKHSSRAIPLFSAVAALMSLLTAAAGLFAQTVKVVRVDTGAEQGQPSQFELVVSAIDAVPQTSDAVTSKTHSQSTPDKPAAVAQPLSGHWESAAELHIPLTDVPAPAAVVIPTRAAPISFQTQLTEFLLSRQVPLKSGRAPPRA